MLIMQILAMKLSDAKFWQSQFVAVIKYLILKLNVSSKIFCLSKC